MRNPFHLAALAVLGAVAPLLLAQDAEPTSPWPILDKPGLSDETSRKLIDLHLKARGGVEALKAVKSLSMKGKLFEGQKEYNIEGLYTHDGAARFEVYYQQRGFEHRTIKATDGKLGWQRKVLPEKQLPSSIGGDDARLLDLEARLPFLFLDYFENEHVFVYRGKLPYLGRVAYVVHGWLASGMQIDVYFDEKTFQILNYRHTYKIAGKEVIVNLTPSKLKKSAGVWWEMEYKMNYEAKTFRRISFSRIETNVEFEKSLFAQPEIKEYWLRSPRP
jgi:hypothetical protein